MKITFAFAVLSFCGLMTTSASADTGPYHLVSPNAKIEVHFDIEQTGMNAGAPVYSVAYAGRPLIGISALGLELKDILPFTPFSIRKLSRRTVDTSYELPVGKARKIRDHYNESIFELVELGGQQRRIDITFRLYDDGIGFRYTIPKQAALIDFAITKEDTAFNLINNPQIYSVELPFKSSFEGFFSSGPITSFAPEKTMTLPVLAGEGPGPWVGISEAGLTDYAGLYLTPAAGNVLEARLAPSLTDPTIKAVGHAPFSTPWRALIIGDSEGALLDSNLINNLNDSTAIADTSWIQPGKIVFPWWNGYNLPTAPGDLDPTHKPGLNTFTLKRYVDFSAANHIPYFSFDGYDQAWYGGDIGNPPNTADVTKSIPQIDMPEVLRYAKSKNVRARLWMHWAALAQAADMEKVFALYQSWGIEGIMLDFLNRDDQVMVQFYMKVIRLAAKHHLSVNFHGAWKPTGVTRTYPNLFSQEGVRSSEYNRFDSRGCPPEHEMNYAFIRQMAGPLDVHPGSFHPVAPEDWSLAKYPLNAMGTLARQLAVYVVMESGMQMVVDAPAAYLAHPEAFEFVKAVPVAWDESKVLEGKVGQHITMARRRGREWYIGSMTDRSARTVEVPLRFLGEGSYDAEIFADGNDPRTRPEEVLLFRRRVTQGDILHLQLGPSGGAAVRLVPVQL